MKFLINSGRYIQYTLNILYIILFMVIQYTLNILYIILFMKIVSSLFFYEYVPEIFKSPYFTLVLLACILIPSLVKKRL